MLVPAKIAPKKHKSVHLRGVGFDADAQRQKPVLLFKQLGGSDPGGFLPVDEATALVERELDQLAVVGERTPPRGRIDGVVPAGAHLYGLGADFLAVNPERNIGHILGNAFGIDSRGQTERLVRAHHMVRGQLHHNFNLCNPLSNK